jgi:hypothetical protein
VRRIRNWNNVLWKRQPNPGQLPKPKRLELQHLYTVADAEVIKMFAKQVSLKFQSVVAVHFIQLLLSLKL